MLGENHDVAGAHQFDHLFLRDRAKKLYVSHEATGRGRLQSPGGQHPLCEVVLMDAEALQMLPSGRELLYEDLHLQQREPRNDLWEALQRAEIVRAGRHKGSSASSRLESPFR